MKIMQNIRRLLHGHRDDMKESQKILEESVKNNERLHREVVKTVEQARMSSLRVIESAHEATRIAQRMMLDDES